MRYIVASDCVIPRPYFAISCMIISPLINRNRNRKLQTSKAPLKSQAQGTSLFTSAVSNQRGFPKNSPWEAQVRFPEGERMHQIRGVFQRIARRKLRSGCQKVRGGYGYKTTKLLQTSNISLSICLSICLSVYLSVYLCIYLSLSIYGIYI